MLLTVDVNIIIEEYISNSVLFVYNIKLGIRSLLLCVKCVACAHPVRCDATWRERRRSPDPPTLLANVITTTNARQNFSSTNGTNCTYPPNQTALSNVKHYYLHLHVNSTTFKHQTRTSYNLECIFYLEEVYHSYLFHFSDVIYNQISSQNGTK